MSIENLSLLPENDRIDCEIVIIGGGPVGLTIAQELSKTFHSVILVESGDLNENPLHNALLKVESVDGALSPAMRSTRSDFHKSAMKFWSGEEQSYGARCRALGGSTHAWAGKSAPFDPIDFEHREWVENSGWPISAEQMVPYLKRAANILNLGPIENDYRILAYGRKIPISDVIIDGNLRSYFWQFARSKINPLEILKFGPEIIDRKTNNVRIITNATVTHINTNEQGDKFSGLELRTIEGKSYELSGKIGILCASAVENPRILLASNRVVPNGVGNRHDAVGRYLTDHVGARIGTMPLSHLRDVNKIFGFYGVNHLGATHMYQHGLSVSEAAQRQYKLLNSAVYFLEMRDRDDPWDSIKRLARGKSERPFQDVSSVVRGVDFIVKGAGQAVINSNLLTLPVREAMLNFILSVMPNTAVREFSSRGLPHKLYGIAIDAITEQPPRRESRIMLSDHADCLGMPIAKIDWKIGKEETFAMYNISKMVENLFSDKNLPAPNIADWVHDEHLSDIPLMDMAHSSGTTRMSTDPTKGVVDENCKIHGVAGLYVGGTSVFPTSGHANPTFMALAMAIRLADHIASIL